MPYVRPSTLRNLRARVETYAQATRDARRVAQAAIENHRRLAEQFVTPDEALTELAAVRLQLTAETRRADRLQARLDDACGITTPAVEAGAMWQQNRTDKTQGVKP
ncbi:hypothetical protein ABT185_07505 [Streptomyces clavifer]|uniref:hypothetical protein n=1 Tax=Streptomyces clavifer TaxID=68188 RepID=UPI0033271A13